MKQYLDVLRKVREQGVPKGDRTGTGTISLWAETMRFDLGEAFPIVTTKKVFWRAVVAELIWFIRGDTNLQFLNERDVHIWDDWPYKKYKQAMEANGASQFLDQKQFGERIKHDPGFAAKWGELGPVYGRQWRHWQKPDGGRVDQLAEVVERIRNNPDDRRMIVSAWNPPEIPKMALPPCHCFFQFYVVGGELSLAMYQRSCDMFLGVPFNISSYALLLMLIAKITGLQPGEFVHMLGDAHIYVNHLAQVDEQLKREPRPLPQLRILKDVRSVADLETLEFSDFKLEGYDPHPAIKAEVAV